MRFKKRTLLCLFFLLAARLLLPGQAKRLISGLVTDIATKEPLPYVTILLKKQLIGVVTNEEGKFDLYVPADVTSDTLLVNYLGYKHFLIEIGEIKQPFNIQLEATVVQLEEIVIRPIQPENYIRMAMLRIKENYPGNPFETEAYYREKILENKKLIKCDEGIFKSYYPNYLDSVKTQHQLMLFRRADTLHKIAFMSREIKKKEQKDSLNTASGKQSESALDIGESFGGPSNILKTDFISKKPEAFLDSNQFKSYTYTFAKSSSYNTSELVVIDFISKGKVNFLKESGKVYIDLNSMAIVKIERQGAFIIPGIIKPILFFLSIGVKNPTYRMKSEFQSVNGKWYPKNIQNDIAVILTNNHLFRKDERSLFEIQQFFTANELRTEGVSEIPVEKRFDGDKDMQKQLYNDAGLSWDGTNIIKK